MSHSQVSSTNHWYCWQVWAVAALIPLAVLYYTFRNKRYKLPRGPRPLPIVGNLHLMGRARGKPHLMFTEMAGRYGDVFSFKMGQHPAIVLNSVSAIKEAMLDRADVFSDRPTCLYFINRFINQKGVVFKNGEGWRDMRRFTLQSLRGFGLGKTSLETRVQQECEALLEAIRNTAGTPFDPHQLLTNAVSNIICAIIFGDRFSYDDANFKKIMALLAKHFRGAGLQRVENFVPWLRFIKPGSKKYMAEVQDIHDTNRAWLMGHVEQHRATFDPDNVRDFVDLYLQAERQGGDRGHFSEANMLRVVMDLFNAGTETTSTTLLWGLLLLMRHPQIQRRCRHDILQVVGESGQLSVADKKQLPYLQATICEIQRLANIAPMSLPHALSEDASFRGYHLPKGTMVIMNLHAVHKDPSHWPEPETFRPERFLDSDNKVIKHEAFMPFSIGKRACLGESLAKTELFLFLGNMLRRFEFRPVHDQDCPPLEGVQGITWCPLPFQLEAHAL